MNFMYELREMLCKELEQMRRNGRGISRGDYESIFYITGGIKNIDKIMMMQGGGMGMGGNYSQATSWEALIRGMPDRGGGHSWDSGNSYARDGMYANESGYSQHGDMKEEIKEFLRQKSKNAKNDEEQQWIRRFMGEMEHM